MQALLKHIEVELRRIIVIWESILKYMLFNLGRVTQIEHVGLTTQESMATISKHGPEAFSVWLSIGIEGIIANRVFICMKLFPYGAIVVVIKF